MTRAKTTLWAGAVLAVTSFAVLLVNEGLFLRVEPPAIALEIAPLACGSQEASGAGPIPFYDGRAPEEQSPATQSSPPMENSKRLAPPSHLPVRVDMGDSTFFSPRADAVLRLDMHAIGVADCARVAIKADAPWRHFDNATTHDPADEVNRDTARGSDYFPAQATTAGVIYRRNANQIQRNQDGSIRPSRHNFVRLIIPEAFARVSSDAFASRLSITGSKADFSFAQSFGKAGYGAFGHRRTDLTFMVSAYRRFSRIISVVFATLLGIGIGAVFEASLTLSTARRLEDMERELAARDQTP